MNPNNKHICTVQLQEYFQHKLFRHVIQSSHWSKLEGFVEEDIDKTLEVLKNNNASATFFTSGWIAEKHPKLLRKITAHGHEIACIGYFDFSFNDVSQDKFISDIRRAKYLIEDATGQAVIGYRAIQKSIFKNKEEFLSILAEEGYLYDSSLHYPLVSFQRIPQNRQNLYQDKKSGLWELPLRTINLGPLHLPVSGGNALRQYPWVVKNIFWQQNWKNIPFILYFHPWELTDLQPQLSAFDSITRLRLYRNLGKVTTHLEQILSRGDFISVSKFLEIKQEKYKPEDRKEILLSTDKIQCDCNLQEEKELTVIIPCYNESDTIPYLQNNLKSMEQGFGKSLLIKYIFVDDKSTDDTVDKLQKIFGDNKQVTIIHHKKNQGVAGAIRTGILSAKTELIASIDADCSYDPLELIPMINLLDKDTAMVTASPYHKDGSVLGVPEWRLFLSKGLSGIYKNILTHQFSTYTACFRVYRKSLVADSINKWGDFRGIVELLVRLDLSGRKVKEFPTTLHSRIFGFSKMKTMKTIQKHLEFLLKFRSIKREINSAGDSFEIIDICK